MLDAPLPSPAVRPASKSETPAVAAHNLGVSYEGRSVLRSVSFEAAAGQLVGIVGPNGRWQEYAAEGHVGVGSVR